MSNPISRRCNTCGEHWWDYHVCVTLPTLTSRSGGVTIESKDEVIADLEEKIKKLQERLDLVIAAATGEQHG